MDNDEQRDYAEEAFNAALLRDGDERENYMVCSGAENPRRVYRYFTWVRANSPEEACQKTLPRLIGDDQNPWSHVVGQGITDVCDNPDHMGHWKDQETDPDEDWPYRNENAYDDSYREFGASNMEFGESDREGLIQHPTRPGVWVRGPLKSEPDWPTE